MRIYLAGPMRGIDQFNFPEFDRVAKILRGMNAYVVSPAEHDREMGFDETLNSLEGFDTRAAIMWDLHKITEVDMLVLLPGWEQSSGVAVEVALAKYLGLPVMPYTGPGTLMRGL